MSYDLPDFDELKKLHETDPERLEALRTELTDALISEAPEEHQKRLLGLQWKIDQEVAKAKSPMASCIAVSGMMNESFDRLKDALNMATGRYDLVWPAEKPEGKVIPMRREK